MGFFETLFGSKKSSDNNANNSGMSGSSNAGTNTRPASSTVTPKPKKAPVKASMDDIFGKGFRFVVDRYEEWANQKCTNQGELNAEIVAEIVGDRIIFTISGAERLSIVKTPSMDLSNPQSTILKAADNFLITSDRIQYLANTITDINRDPYVCHLFYENGKISYIRFGFLHPDSSSVAPYPSRIYEFYGDMVELDSASRPKTTKTEFKPFVFKSTCHQRYENVMPVRGLQQCVRTVTVEKNINGCSGYLIQPGDGYIVKVFNNDIGQPNMSDKPMRVKSILPNLVVLQGYPLKAKSPFGWMDVDYSEYGLDIHYRHGEIEKCVLHMYERDTYIEYRK